ELALGAPVTFTAIAADDSGDLSARIVWVSDADGVLGVGREITTSGLSAGAHRVTASVVDPSGALGTASVSVTVVPPPLVFPAGECGLRRDRGGRRRRRLQLRAPDTIVERCRVHCPRGRDRRPGAARLPRAAGPVAAPGADHGAGGRRERRRGHAGDPRRDGD